MNDSMKIEVLGALLEKYQEWSNRFQLFCHKGCSTCCTQNVNMTATEGEVIFRFVRKEHKEEWIAGKLNEPRNASRNSFTMNAFARACLEQKYEGEEEHIKFEGRCPFLENNLCSIYSVRPLACRCLVSTVDCSTTGEAEMSQHFMAINTVSMQIAEHIGQNEYWGNMLDVLMAMLDMPINNDILNHIQQKKEVDYARARLLKAEPVPGFLLLPEEENEVQLFIDGVFAEKIDKRMVGDIINNR